MVDEQCQFSVVLFSRIDFKSLEEIGIYINNSRCSGYQKFVLGITGELEIMGNWNPEKGIICKYEDTADDGSEIWSCRFTLHLCRAFQFRFFVAELSDANDEYDSQTLRVLAWESRLKPRMFSVIDYFNAEDKSILNHFNFGIFENGKFVQRGWLTNSSEIHIRLTGSSCKFFKNNLCHLQNHSRLYIACCRYILQPVYTEDEDTDTILDQTIFKSECTNERLSLSHTSQRPLTVRFPSFNTSFGMNPLSRAHPVLLSTLEINRCRVHRGEQTECWGTLYKPGDDVIFYTETSDVENTAVEVEFYYQKIKSPSENDPNELDAPLKFIGSARFGPFMDTYGRKASQILNSKHLPIGDLRVTYLVIHPMTKIPYTSLAVSYQHHWKKRATIDIGHRGMGTSFIQPEEKDLKKPSTTKENTLDSFRTAVQHGADFVEMDVQLTKDHQVVVYHDYETVIVSKKKRGGGLSYIPIAIKDLNYEDLRELKVNHSSVLKESHTREKMDEDDLDPIDLQPFPLLRSCFEEIDSDLGFVIEVKYPMELRTGGSELPNFFEYNFYIDTILREILTYAGKRRILLSCFDPNVCIMLQLKQNIYPVFQLGIAPEYTDSRQLDFERLFWSALSQQLMGVCVESDRVLNVPNVIQLAHSHNLVVLAWGEAVNDPKTRAQLIQLGVDGIIYDRLYESKEKGALSIFKQERNGNLITNTIDVSKQLTIDDKSSCEQNQLLIEQSHILNNLEQLDSDKSAQLFHPDSTHVPIIKDCLVLEKLSGNATDSSTTHCTSHSTSLLNTAIQISPIEPEEIKSESLMAMTVQSENLSKSTSASQPSTSTAAPVLSDVAACTSSSSSQHVVAVITLA